MDNLYIGIDIGGTKCACILADETPMIIDKISFPTQVEKGPEYAINKIIDSIEEIIKTQNVDKTLIKSIGISCGGPLDSKKGLILSPPNLPAWNEIPIVDIIKNRFNIPTFLQNDANAGALAEWKFGAGIGTNNMIFLTFGTGMGAGLILNGKLYSGTNDMAGEVGHIRIAESGPEGYGKKGSFEGFCSGGGIAKLAKIIINDYMNKGIEIDLVKKIDINNITTKDLAIAAQNGDEVAKEIFKISGYKLGLGLSMLIDILNPELIVIGSVFARSKELLWPYAEKVIKKEALGISYNVCRIEPAKLGEHIGDYAAISVAVNGLNEIEME